MIEVKQLAGIKDVYGDDIVLAQTEPLQALEALCKNFGNFIVSGCEVTPNVGTPANFDIAPGLVAVQHADGFKLARFSGVTNTSALGKLYIDKVTTNTNYASGSNTGFVEYRALFTTAAVPGGAPFVEIVNPLTTPVNNIFKAIKSNTVTPFTSSGITFMSPVGVYTWANIGSPYYNVGYAVDGNIVRLCGACQITLLDGDPNPIITLPPEARPASKVYLTIIGSGAINGTVHAFIDTSGVMTMWGGPLAAQQVYLDGISFRKY